MKVYFIVDELWPHISVFTDVQGTLEIDIPVETVDRYEAASKEFFAARKPILEAYNNFGRRK